MKSFKFIILLFIALASCSQSASKKEQFLKGFTGSMNKKLPMHVDPYVSLDSTTVQPGTIVCYHYTLKAEATPDEIAAYVSDKKKAMIAVFINNPEADDFRKIGLQFDCRYNDPSGRFLFSFTIRPEEYTAAAK